MNALIIAVAVLAAAVTLSVVETTPANSYRNPSSKCCSVEPLGGTTDQDSSEGCTCSGSWQPHCCCPNPQCCPNQRRYRLPTCRPQQPPTIRLPSCNGPPSATPPSPYQAVPYSPWPTMSCPDLPCSAPGPCPRPCTAPVTVSVGPPSCAPQQPTYPFCAPQQQLSCASGEPPSSVSCSSSPSDLAELVTSSSSCAVPTQRLQLPKFVPVALKPLSFNIHRPSAQCRPGCEGYGTLAPSLFSTFGFGSPTPYKSYNYK